MSSQSGHTSPPWSTTTKAIVAVVTLVLAGLLIWRFSGLIPMLAYAALIAYLLHPLVTFVDIRTGLSRSQTVLLVYLAFTLVFLGGSTAVGFIAVEEIVMLSQSLPERFVRALSFVNTLPDLIPETVPLGPYTLRLEPIRTQIELQLNQMLNPQTLYSQIFSLIEPIFSQGGTLAANVVQTTVSFIGLAVTVFIISIYIANDIPRYGYLIGELAQQPGYRYDAERLVTDTSRIWAAYLRGQIILGIVIFCVVSIVLSVLGVNNALGLGLLSGIMEFLPVIGPLIGAGAAILVALFQASNVWGLSSLQFALLVAGAMILIQQLENSVLVPRIVGDALDLHPLLVMVSVIMGASLAGLLGAVLAAPVVATIKLYGGYAWRKMLDLPPFPEDADPEHNGDLPMTWLQRIRNFAQPILDRIKTLLPDYPSDPNRSTAHEPKRTEGVNSMASNTIYPLQFEPVFKDYPWGGRNLATVLDRDIPEGIVAESWEISAHPNGQTRVSHGPLAGLTLGEVQQKLGEDLVGTRNSRALELDKFPLLVKLLDANRWLSVQVHPDDDYALANEDEYGKTEMWIVLHAKPGSELIYGLKRGVDRATFVQAVKEERSQDLLHRVTVKPGDVIFVPAGSVHSLGPGIIVAEIQQNSDTTYRIYDWGRLGNDGNPRPLHVEQALEVIDWSQVEPGPVTPEPIASADQSGVRAELIGQSEYFRTERIYLDAGRRYSGRCDGETYQIWAVLTGSAELYWDGDSVGLEGISWLLLPARLGNYSIEGNSDSVLLHVETPAE